MEQVTAADVAVSSLLVEGVKAKTELLELITSCDLKRSIDGAPTLTVGIEDPHGTLVSNGFFDQRLTVQIDGKGFELVQIRKQGRAFTLTFEDLAVAEMRKHKDPRKVEGGQMTRTEFAAMLLSETPWIPLRVHPSVHEEKAKVALSRGVVATEATGGAADPNYFAGGIAGTGNAGAGGLSADETEFMASVAQQTGLDPAVVLSWIGAESGWNKTKGDHNYLNIGPGRAYASASAAASATASLINGSSIYAGIRAAIPQGGPAQIKAIGSSRWGTNAGVLSSVYASHGGAAAAAAIAATTGKLTSAKENKITKQSIEGTAEDTWTCLKRIFGEVNWRCYVDWNQQNVAGVYVGPDTAFLLAPPEIAISEDSEGVDYIDYDFDLGKTQSTVTITMRAHRWQLPPGTSIMLTQTGLPNPWLVSAIDRSLFTSTVNVTATSPLPELPEPDPPADPSGAVDANYFGVGSGLSGGGTGAYIWPVGGSHQITGRFGETRPGHIHEGLDIAAPEGTPIVASASGTVSFAGSQSGYGNVVYITHPNGAETRYAHMSVIESRRGMVVNQGQEIGKVGHTGDATGPHVHLEIRIGGKAVDPLPLLGSGDAGTFVNSPSAKPKLAPTFFTGGSGAGGSW